MNSWLYTPIPPLRGETGYPALAPIEKEVNEDNLRKQFEPNTDSIFDNPTLSGSVDVNEMAEFPISWQLKRSTSNVHQKKNRYVSNLKINTEWSLVCLWSQYDPYKPEFLEIRRNSTAKEILVSGTFKLMRDGQFVVQRKFVQLIEAGFATTQIELEYSNDNYYCNRNYSITGTLTIPAHTADKEYGKGVQFKSLLDLSNDFECLLDPKTTYFSDV
ncbi:hypothetical protein AVEN_66988-1, partial [Araneus ventricosus]